MKEPFSITYDSSHYFLLSCTGGWLQIDSGMPGTFPEYLKLLQRAGVELKSIKYLILTHHHPDHAGIHQDLKNAGGAHIIIHEKQIPFLGNLQALYAKKPGYTPIQIGPNDVIIRNNSRAVLKGIGIQGEMIETPGHSDDSISLVLDSGETFVGDLHPPFFASGEDFEKSCESWRKIIKAGAQRVYPTHGGAYPIQLVEDSLPDN